MATIRTAIALYDGVTSPLHSMQKAMNIVLNSFEAMQMACSNAVDVSAIQEARDELAKAETAFDSIEQNIREADNQQQKFNGSIRAGSTAADGLWNKLKGIAATVGGIVGLNKVLGISDQLTSTNARLNNAMVTFDDGGSLTELQKKVMASAQRSRSAYMDTAAAVAKLGMNAKDAFGNMNEVIMFSELVNKQFVNGGASAQEQAASMLQLTQAMASGVLRGEELNSIFENAPGIIQNIANYLDVPIGKIRTMASEGQITADIVKNAMFAAADDIEEKFNNMPKTWGQIWTSMQNKALSIFTPILNKLNQIANSAKFETVTNGIINGLAAIASVATGVLDLLINGASWVVDNWSILAPVIGGVATALLLYNGYLIANNVLTAISNAQKGLAAVQAYKAAAANTTLAATEKAEAMAKASATAAQYGFNAALLACPITWIIVLIIALIAALILLWDNCEGFRNFMITMWAEQTKAIAGFYNNTVVPIANNVIGVQNDLMDATKNFCASIVNGFADLALGVVDNLSWVTDKVRDMMELYNEVTSFFGGKTFDLDYAFSTDGINAMRDKALANLDKAFEYTKYHEFVSLDLDKFNEFVDNAANTARDFRVSDFISNTIKDLLGPTNELENILDDIYGSTGDTANNTAATADALDIAEEDLSYLRDIAEREAINRFTTAEIKVEQTNTNYIDKETDLDGIMDAWANDFAEKLDVSEEGVHE